MSADLSVSGSRAVRALAEAALAGHPVPLGEVLARAALLARFDRTYLVPVPAFSAFAARLTDPRRAEPLRVLEIGGRRCFGYHSVYYDTAGLRTFHDHRQGRRQRFKVRERLYTDSGERQFEVKLKGRRGETLKYRQPMETWSARAGSRPPGEGQRRFLGETLRAAYGIAPPASLSPSLITDYVRATFVGDGQRVTCDAGLVCRDAAGARGDIVRGSSGLVLVETKSSGHLTDVDRLLHAHGIRAAEFTKYASLAALRPSLPDNRWRRALRQVFSPVT